jgi:hypothetical protein
MKLREKAAVQVRIGEQDVAGRRIVARLWPCAGYETSAVFQFDPVERRFLTSAKGGPAADPAEPEVWRSAVRRAPFGPVLVGPGGPGAEAAVAYRAAAEGAALAGRGVYLLDPAAGALPERGKRSFVVLLMVRPDQDVPSALPAAAALGFPAGVLFPLLPDWTDDPTLLDGAVERAAASGASFARGIVAADDGAARRSMVEARGELDPGARDDFFDRVHHGEWAAGLERALRSVEKSCARVRVAAIPPRPAGLAESPGNSRASGRLEERADAFAASDEHRASLYRAAVRWIDESDRDLTAIFREGNFRKVFPFPEEIAAEAETVFQERP